MDRTLPTLDHSTPSMEDRAPRIRREGLTVLREPQNATIESVYEFVSHGAQPEDADKSYSLVFVHGLNGHPYESWTKEPKGFFWPLHLAGYFEEARVLTFGYNADFYLGNNNLMGLRQHAEVLLVNLRNNRQKAVVLHRLDTSDVC